MYSRVIHGGPSGNVKELLRFLSIYSVSQGLNTCVHMLKI